MSGLLSCIEMSLLLLFLLLNVFSPLSPFSNSEDVSPLLVRELLPEVGPLLLLVENTQLQEKKANSIGSEYCSLKARSFAGDISFCFRQWLQGKFPSHFVLRERQKSQLERRDSGFNIDRLLCYVLLLLLVSNMIQSINILGWVSNRRRKECVRKEVQQ